MVTSNYLILMYILLQGKGVMRTYWLDGKEGFDGALPHLVE